MRLRLGNKVDADTLYASLYQIYARAPFPPHFRRPADPKPFAVLGAWGDFLAAAPSSSELAPLLRLLGLQEEGVPRSRLDGHQGQPRAQTPSLQARRPARPPAGPLTLACWV